MPPDQVWLICGIAALIVSGIFAVFIPRKNKVMMLKGLTYIIVRWFHSLVWLLLALSFFVRIPSNEIIQALANPLAGLAGIGYLIYIITLTSALKS